MKALCTTFCARCHLFKDRCATIDFGTGWQKVCEQCRQGGGYKVHEQHTDIPQPEDPDYIGYQLWLDERNGVTGETP